MSNARQNVIRAHSGLLLWALLVGLSFPVVGLMSDGLPPLLLAALRFVIAALAVLPWVWRGPNPWPSLPGLALYTLMGLCLAGFFGATFWAAAHQATALSMAALFVSVPPTAYCLGRWVGVEPRAGGLLAILALGAVGALGLALAQTGGQLSELRLGIAEAVFFAGCLGSALYPVLSKWGLARGWLPRQAPLRTFWSLLAGGVLAGSLGLIWEAPQALASLTLADGLLLVYLGVFSTGMTFWLQQRATFVLTPGAVTAYSYLVPLVSMLVLFIGQSQRIGWHWLPGSLLVLLAIALLLHRDATKGQTSGGQLTAATMDPRGSAIQAEPAHSGASPRALSTH